MLLKEELIQYNDLYNIEVNSNVYTSVFLCFLTNRNLIVVSEDFQRTENELRVIVDLYWKIGLRIKKITPETKIEDLKKFLEDGNVFLLLGIDLLKNDSQLELLDFIHKTQKTRELSSVIGVVEDTTKLVRYLKDEFWFQQGHSFEPGSHFEVPKELNDSIQFNRIKLHNFIQLRTQIQSITVVSELKRYAYDIIIFTRTHRCVNTGIAQKHYEELLLLGRALCLVFGRKYLIPSILKLAARKLVPLHIEIIAAQHEPSIQWGSDPVLAAELIRRSSGLTVTEDVLNKVWVPL